MTNLERGFYAYLLSLPAVVAIIGTRAFRGVLEQETDYPALRFQQVALMAQGYTHDGEDGTVTARMQVDYFAQEASGADPWEQVSALAAAVKGDRNSPALSGFRGVWGGSPFDVRVASAFLMNVSDTYDPDERGVVRRMHEYAISYYED